MVELRMGSEQGRNRADRIDISYPPSCDPPWVVALWRKAPDGALIEIPDLIEVGHIDAPDGGCLFQELRGSSPLGCGFLKTSQELREELFPLTDEKSVEEIGERLRIEKNGYAPTDY